MEGRNVVDYRFLARKTTKGRSTPITDIVKSIKKQKGKPCEMNLPLLKKRYQKKTKPLILRVS